MKKILLALGSVTAEASPIIAVVSCGISGGTTDTAEFDREMKEAVAQINSSNLSQSEKDAALARLQDVGNFSGFSGRISEIISGIKS